MRQPANRFLLLLFLALFATVGRAYADPRTEARTHYQQGQKLYASGDYRGAITEFSAAQQLMPADLNNYNLALCYDKLGEAEPAIQYYREFLNKQPNDGRRAEIEASISRLEAALKSASAKRDDAKRAEDARRADEARRAEEAKKAEKPPVVAPEPPPPQPTGVGSTGVPATGQTVSTGDAQLDRVQSIDVNGVRDQRVGGAASGMAATNGGPATNPQGAAAPAPGPQQPGTGPGPDQQPPKKPTPVYKKWWFWAVVAVSAYVVYSIATESSNSRTARELPGTGGMQTTPDSGPTLFRF